MTVVLVTGATGFVGRYVVDELVRLNIPVKCNVRKHEQNLPKQVKQVILSDLFSGTDYELDELLDQVDLLIHCAWYVNHRDYMTSNENLVSLAGSIRLANVALRKNIRKFTGIGTCAEYDWSKSEKHKSLDYLNPNSPYGAAKAAAYTALSASFRKTNVDFLWCRLFNIFGLGESPNRLGALVKSSIANDSDLMLSSSQNVLDFLHVKTVARNIVALSLGDYSGPHNVCSGRAQTVKDFALDYAASKNKQHLLKFPETSVKCKPTKIIVGQPTLVVTVNETKLEIDDDKRF